MHLQDGLALASASYRWTRRCRRRFAACALPAPVRTRCHRGRGTADQAVTGSPSEFAERHLGVSGDVLGPTGADGRLYGARARRGGTSESRDPVSAVEMGVTSARALRPRPRHRSSSDKRPFRGLAELRSARAGDQGVALGGV
jgi:hypothetical protein